MVLAWSGFGLAPRPALAALDCNGVPATIEVSGPGTYYGTGGPDVFAGYGNSGVYPAAIIYALAGDDVICVTDASAIYAGSGNDVVRPFGICAWEIHGGSGNDYLGCAVKIWGDSGDDVIDFWGGEAYGGSGNDRINHQFGLGYCDGGSGVDTATCQTVVNVP